MKLIKFTLSAPLQSWGEDARWDLRTTAAMPTKSAIVGLLACCLGLPRGDERLKRLDSKLSMAVRADSPGRIMTDFHTVQGTDGLFLNAEGKPRGGGSTIITPKQYLQDACFTVFIWGDEAALENCYEAMLHPCWPVYLGRKSCVPAVPVKPQWIEADTPENAVAHFTDDEKAKSAPVVHVEMDTDLNVPLKEGQRLVVRKDLIYRADRNEYGSRWVCAYAIPSGGENTCT